MHKPASLLILLTVITLCMSVLPSHAYSYSFGVQLGDEIEINYTLYRNDTAQLVEIFQFQRVVVEYGEEIDGLIDTLLGMRIGDHVTVTIPAERGYTDTSHWLYGVALNATIFIWGLAQDSTPPPSQQQTLEDNQDLSAQHDQPQLQIQENFGLIFALVVLSITLGLLVEAVRKSNLSTIK